MKKWIAREIAEVLGVLGVIGSLVFVAFEIQQNTSAVRSQASQGLQDQITAIYGMLINDPTMMGVYLRGMAEPSSLTSEELARFHGFWTASLQAHQNLYTQLQENAYNESMADGWWQLLRDNLEFPGAKEHLAVRGFLLSPDFREYIDSEVMTREPSEDPRVLGVGQ